jgi:hypothetical protein
VTGVTGAKVVGVVSDYMIVRVNVPSIPLPEDTDNPIGPFLVESLSGNAIGYDGMFNFPISQSGLYQITYNVFFGPVDPASNENTVTIWWQSTRIPAQMGATQSVRNYQYLNNNTTIQLLAGDSVSFLISSTIPINVNGAVDLTSGTRMSIVRLVQREDIIVRLQTNQPLQSMGDTPFTNTTIESIDGVITETNGQYTIGSAGTYEIGFNATISGGASGQAMSTWFEYPVASGNQFALSINDTSNLLCNGVSCLRFMISTTILARFLTYQPESGQIAIGAAAKTSPTRFSLVQYISGSNAQILAHVPTNQIITTNVATLLVQMLDYAQGNVSYDGSGVFTIGSAGIYRIIYEAVAAVGSNTGQTNLYATWWDIENVYGTTEFGRSETDADLGSMNGVETLLLPSGAQIRFWAFNGATNITTWNSPYFAIIQLA